MYSSMFVKGVFSRIIKSADLDQTALVEQSDLDLLGGGRVVRRYWVNFQCRGVLPIWITVGQGPIVLAMGAGGGCLDIFFSRLSFLSSFSLSL